MSDEPSSELFLPLRNAATRLGVPAAWLRDEARAGRVPHLRAGRRLLINLKTVERVLISRAEQLAKEGDGG